MFLVVVVVVFGRFPRKFPIGKEKKMQYLSLVTTEIKYILWIIKLTKQIEKKSGKKIFDFPGKLLMFLDFRYDFQQTNKKLFHLDWLMDFFETKTNQKCYLIFVVIIFDPKTKKVNQRFNWVHFWSDKFFSLW